MPLGDEGCPRSREQGAEGPLGKIQPAIARSSSSRFATPSTPRRFAATPKVSCSCSRRRASTIGRSTTATAPCLWRGGCIIRAVFLDRIKEAFDANPKLENLLLAPYFAKAVADAQDAWRHVVATAAELGIPVPVFATRTRLLRRLSPRPLAGEPAASPTRLLRSAHLRTDRQTRNVPHRLDPTNAERRNNVERLATSDLRLTTYDLRLTTSPCPTSCKSCLVSMARSPW